MLRYKFAYIIKSNMPRIVLKDKSPEFADTRKKQKITTCEMPGCSDTAEHKAPKHRQLNEYYNFCFEHAKEYNKAWNFFDGMSNKEVEDHMIRSYYGDRPTWKYNAGDTPEDKLYNAAQQTYNYSDEHTNTQEQQSNHFHGDRNTPEYEAMALMGLEPPVTLEKIKEKYKALAKKYHPDLNKDNPKAEELLKKINMAYTILKLAYEDYQDLPQS